MNGNKLSVSDYQIFIYKILVLLGLTWVGFGLALANYFYASIAWLITFLLAVFLFKQAKKHRVILTLSREMKIACLVSVLVATLFVSFSSPTVFSGRDQGAISESAIRLSQNHKFAFSNPTTEAFFKLHEKGKAQNFPGFYYDSNGSLVPQFPLVYITWLALFFSTFGVFGFAIANATLMFFFLMSFYFLMRLFLDYLAAIPAMLFTITSFVFMWFSKFTLSENMALPLLWISILILVLFLQHQRKLYYFTLIASLILLCFTRIEGYAFLLAAFIITMSNKETREYIKSKISTRLVLPIFFFVIIFAFNFFNDISFFREMAKAIFPSVKLPQASYLGDLKNADLPEYFTLKLFYIYGMIGFFIIGAINIFSLIRKKQYQKLIPLIIVLPTFLYFFDSNITPDHPWMLRRYMFSLFPLAVFYTGLLIGQWLEKKPNEKYSHALKIASVIIFMILILGNIPAFAYFLPHSENKGLLDQTEKFSQQFSNNDLILIDREVTGDGWSMIAGPLNSLYGKNAVYFYNIQDLNKLDLKKFDNIYLVAPNSQISHYQNSTLGKRISESGEYSFTFSKLKTHREEPFDKVDFPPKKQVTVSGKIYKIEK